MQSNKKITFYPQLAQTSPENTSYFEQFKGKSFEDFWNMLPKKLVYYSYEKELAEITEKKRYVRVKKATGLGISEFYLRWIAWQCLNSKEDSPDVFAVLVTGPRLELAVQLMERLKGLFNFQFDTKNTVCIINGRKIEAFPSHHLASARGLNPKIVLLDEADFFPIGQQEEARSVSERYIPKSNPYLKNLD